MTMHYLRKEIFLFLFLLWPLEFTSRSILTFPQNSISSEELNGLNEELHENDISQHSRIEVTEDSTDIKKDEIIRADIDNKVNANGANPSDDVESDQVIEDDFENKVNDNDANTQNVESNQAEEADVDNKVNDNDTIGFESELSADSKMREMRITENEKDRIISDRNMEENKQKIDYEQPEDEMLFTETIETFDEEFYEPLTEYHYFDSIMDSENFYEPYSETFEDIVEPLDSYSEYSGFGVTSIFEQDSQIQIPEAFQNEGYKAVKLNQESLKSSRTGKSTSTEDNQPTSEDSYNRQHCYPVEKIVYEEQCVPYMHKTCSQIHQQECSQTIRKNCSPVVKPNIETKCEEVEERFCELKLTNEKSDCPIETVSICDTVYSIEESDTVSTECMEIQTVSPIDEWQELEDITCTFSSELDCRYSSIEYCKLKPTHKCNKTPRQFSMRSYEHKSVCKPLKEQKLKSVSDVRCKIEEINKCPDESYENCVNKKREICLTLSWERLEEECMDLEIPECKYIPINNCVEVEKEHCELFQTVQTKMFCSQEIDTDQSTVFYL